MKIQLLIGMIGSGKSTYARRRADEGAIVVCHDDLTQMLHARYRYEAGLKAMYRRMEESLVVAAAISGKDVVIDRTHLTAESRRRWIGLRWWLDRELMGVSDHEIDSFEAVIFPFSTAYEHACRRYAADSRGRPFSEWLKVALHHEEQWHKEPISHDEGFDRIVRLDEGAAACWSSPRQLDAYPSPPRA